jgi:hypothetical protein
MSIMTKKDGRLLLYQVATYQVNRLTSKQQGTGPAATSRHPTITKWSRATHLILKRRKTGGEIINRSL